MINSKSRSLLVIIPDRLTQIVNKGELQPCYYNPGELFEDVHILMTNDDTPDVTSLQSMVGKARLHLHNWSDDLTLPTRHLTFVSGMRLRHWAKGGVDIVRRIAPDLIRCHGADWNTYLAAQIKKSLGIPYVVSLHINPDVNPPRRYTSERLTRSQRRHNAFYEYLEREGLIHADLVMPVYQPILPYLERLGIHRADVCYNILNGTSLREKTDYSLHDPVRLISVGRLIDQKDPSNIIRAMANLPSTHLTIVGDGPRRPHLEALAGSLGVGNRVAFEPALHNDELCRRLHEFDVFVTHTEYWEINKSVLEAVLTGLPCILNHRIGSDVPEFKGGFVKLVVNTPEAYGQALSDLLADHEGREALGRHAFTHARDRWNPSITEAKVVRIYRGFIEGHGACPVKEKSVL